LPFFHLLSNGCQFSDLLTPRRCQQIGQAVITPTVIRQQMGHASAAITALYTGELSLEDVRTEFRLQFGPTTHALEMLGTGQQRENPLKNRSFASIFF
jgi:hypothetical protein